MLTHKVIFKFYLVFFFLLFIPGIIEAHCDSMEGPVVKASKEALKTGNVNYVLIWVKAEYENEVKTFFDQVVRVRALNDEAKDLADKYFFETVVRLHRMGEGIGYTGLKPIGYKPEKGIEQADIAVDKNNIDPILADMNKNSHSKIKELFSDLQKKKDFQVDNVKAGREYVDSYVHFIHYIEELYAAKENKTTEHQH